MKMWLKHDEAKEFRQKLLDIHVYITEYGLNKFKEVCKAKISNFKHMKKIFRIPGNYKQFVSCVHEGFQKAQEMIISELQDIKKERDEVQQQLILARRNKNKKEIKDLRDNEISLFNKECIIRKLADSIAWQLFGTGHHIARRLHVDGPPHPIVIKNLESGLEFTKHYNNQHAHRFALLSDITSFIQIGDALIVDMSGDFPKLIIAELKEGRVNEEVLKDIDNYSKTKCNRFVYLLAKEKGKKYFEQLIRVVKQFIRMSCRSKIIEEDGGKDFNGTNIKISKDTFVTQHFNYKIIKMIAKCRKKKWAIGIIDNCLFVGAYAEDFPSSMAFYGWIRGMKIQYPIYDFRLAFKVQCMLPPFLVPLGERSNIFDLAMGQTRLLFCLNYDLFFRKARKMGIQGTWVSRKETAELLKTGKKSKNRELITFDHRLVKFERNNKVLHLGYGILLRMICEFATPASMLKFINEYLRHAEKE